ncbi:hypothetical protein ACFU0X_34795 [Streptomyces cellulosae]|uniref:Uncharacterized protein n=1 Tax=Streptomyces cellulosae TaxID=1968 RepID=A0ABW6JVP3_STRCE
MRPCHWHEDRDGTRSLIPGCHTRAQDPDGEACDCPSLAQQLDKAREEIARLKRELDGARFWCGHVTAAVHAHRDGLDIMQDAARRAEADIAARKSARLPSPR